MELYVVAVLLLNFEHFRLLLNAVSASKVMFQEFYSSGKFMFKLSLAHRFCSCRPSQRKKSFPISVNTVQREETTFG